MSSFKTTIRPYENLGFGAMVNTFDHVWFDGYDWIVQLNPDVLINHDTWILEQMVHTCVDAIFYHCVRPCGILVLSVPFDFIQYCRLVSNITR
jgi:hypothetical protein